MTYATPQDMIDAFGARECAMIADPDDSGTADQAVLGRALAAATNEINFAAGQRCPLPLTIGDPTVAQFLQQLCLDIARYRLTGTSGVTVTAACNDRYVEAKAQLDKVVAGKILLCDPNAVAAIVAAGGQGGLNPNAVTAGEAESVGAPRQLTPDSLCDYTHPRPTRFY